MRTCRLLTRMRTLKAERRCVNCQEREPHREAARGRWPAADLAARPQGRGGEARWPAAGALSTPPAVPSDEPSGRLAGQVPGGVSTHQQCLTAPRARWPRVQRNQTKMTKVHRDVGNGTACCLELFMSHRSKQTRN